MNIVITMPEKLADRILQELALDGHYPAIRDENEQDRKSQREWYGLKA